MVSNPQRVRTLLVENLPESLGLLLDPGEPPERVEGSFVDGEGRSTRSDALFRVRLRTGKSALVYALLEHKSHRDPATPVQILGYMVSIWKAELEQAGARSGRRLPAIVPLVFYHGADTWNVPLSVFEMIDMPPGLEKTLGGFGYFLYNFGSTDSARLSEDPEANAALLALAVAKQKRHTSEQLDAITGGADFRGEFGRHIFLYLMEKSSIDEPELEASLKRTNPEEWETMMGTLAEKWLAQGEARGRFEGEARGKAKGRMELLQEQLERRFGELPSDIRHRIRNAKDSEIRSWAVAVLDAATLDDVLAAGTREH